MFSRFCHLLSDIASDCLNSAIKHNKNKDKDNVLQTYCKVLQSITKYFNILESITNYYKVLQSVTKYYKDNIVNIVNLGDIVDIVNVVNIISVTECYRVLQSVKKY